MENPKPIKLGFSFLPIPEELMASKALSWGAKHLFGIYGKANKEDIKWDAKYLAERMGCEVREARRRKKELVENQLITVKKHPGKKDEVSINLSLITLIQTPVQTDRGKRTRNGQGFTTQNGQGSNPYILKELKKEGTFLERVKNGEKPTYRGMQMRWSEGMIKVIPKDGGSWLEFADSEDKIIWQ